MKALSYIPDKGPSTLPVVSAEVHANLVMVYFDCQHDHQHDRLYLVGARVVAHEAGRPARARNIVRLTSGGPPDTAAKEERLLAGFVAAVLEAVVALAAPDSNGQKRAPIHVVHWGAFARQLLLQGLARCVGAVSDAAPALYDFLTQIAPSDAPVATSLEDEVRRLNYPLLAQTLHSVAAYHGFGWDRGARYRQVFKERLFDATGRTEQGEFYTRRARFDSQIPLEYAYAAWGELSSVPGWDPARWYRRATPALLRGLLRRHLLALEWIVRRPGPFPRSREERQRAKVEPRPSGPPRREAGIRPNPGLRKPLVALPDLAAYQSKATSLAGALREFVLIERYATLADWKRDRHAPPEQRALAGHTLVTRFHEADQDRQTLQQNHQNQAAAEQGERWPQEGLAVRLRLERAYLDPALALCDLEPGDRVVVCPRLVCDERLPPAERRWDAPTPGKLRHGLRAEIIEIAVERDEAGGVPVAAVLRLQTCAGQARDAHGLFYFPAAGARPFENGGLYTLDPDPNDAYAHQQHKVVCALRAIEEGEQTGRHVLYDRLNGRTVGKNADEETTWPETTWPEAARAGQRRFLQGLVAARTAGLWPDDYDMADAAYVGGLGEVPLLLVQGPPGTGKSRKSAVKALAHVQGAMAAGRDCRVFLVANSHSATDVLAAMVAGALAKLRRVRRADPALFARFFDERLLDVPLFRAAPRVPVPDGVAALPKGHNTGTKGRASNADRIWAQRWGVVAATPGGVYGLYDGRWTRKTFALKEHCHLLVLDEASRMSLPEAMLAGLPLAPGGQVVVVGDHRQMAPIVQHDWAHEPRRTFGEYEAFRSLYDALLPLGVPRVAFSRSYRCHQILARVLNHLWYRKDGVPYHSRETAVLPALAVADDYVRAVLTPECPLTLIVHDEAASQKDNPLERALLAPIIAALTDPGLYNLDAQTGVGIVATHRSQRAAFQREHPRLAAAVKTVEKYQGDERDVIVVSVTESDPYYLQAAGAFLLDPRRLCVALSRARKKVVLVVSRSVFEMLSTDAAIWEASLAWQALRRRFATRLLWQGERAGSGVTVWGNGGNE